MQAQPEALVLTASTERKLRSAAAAVLFAAFASYFLYDGFVGYPRRNLSALHDTLNPRPPQPPGMREAVHPKAVRLYPPGTTLETLEAHLGPPGWQAGRERRWFGPSGSLRVTEENGSAATLEWIPGPYRDVYLQRWIGFALLAITAGFALLFVRVMLTRVVADGSGLSIRGHRHINYDEILSIGASEWKTNGWIDLEVRHHAKPFTLRLDAYTYGGLPALVRRVCESRGWPLPETLAGQGPQSPLPSGGG